MVLATFMRGICFYSMTWLCLLLLDNATLLTSTGISTMVDANWCWPLLNGMGLLAFLASLTSFVNATVVL
jgi:hypothetical protein